METKNDPEVLFSVNKPRAYSQKTPVTIYNRNNHHSLSRLSTFLLQYSTDALSPENKNIHMLAYSNDNQIIYYFLAVILSCHWSKHGHVTKIFCYIVIRKSVFHGVLTARSICNDRTNTVCTYDP